MDLGTLGVDASRYAPRRAGAGRYVAALLREFGRQPHRFAAVRVYAPPGSPALYEDEGALAPVALGPRLPDPLWRSLRLAPRARRDRLLFCPATAVPLGFRGRAVVGIEDDEDDREEPGRWRALRRRRSVRAAVRVIAGSEATGDELVRRDGVAPERVAVIYPGVDDACRPPAGPEEGRALRAKLGLGDAPFVLFVGAVSARRGAGLLLDALEHLRRVYDLPHRLVVVGPDAHGFALPARLDYRGLGADVSYFPDLPPAALVPLYGAATAFALPAAGAGFPTALVEALACGCPAIVPPGATLEGGVERAVYPAPEANAAGLAAALAAVAEDAALRDDLRARGLACAATFTWPRAAAATLRLLERVASE